MNATTSGLAVKIARTNADQRARRKASASGALTGALSPHATLSRGAPSVVANVRRRSSPRITFRPTAAKSLAAFPRDYERAAVEGGAVHGAFGATRVGTLLDRLRLHLRTDRFLAERRRDAEWESACDSATAALDRIVSRMKPGKLVERLISRRADRRR